VLEKTLLDFKRNGLGLEARKKNKVKKQDHEKKQDPEKKKE